MRSIFLSLFALAMSACGNGGHTIYENADRVIANPKDSVALENVRRGLRSPFSGVRIDAAIGLKLIGREHPTLGPIYVADLVSGMKDNVHGVRRGCVEALIPIASPSTVEAIPALIERLSEHTDVAFLSAEALGAYGKLAKDAVPPLCQRLRELIPVADVHLLAEDCARALGEIGDPAAIPCLQEATRSPSERTREAAEKALLKLSPKVGE